MRLKIKDIVHTGRHGELGQSKVGEKYEQRKNKCFNFDPDDCKPGDSLVLFLENYYHTGLLTTQFVRSYFDVNGDYIIQTINSFYICEVIEIAGETKED